MSLITYITVTFSFSGTHFWPDATGNHEYLKNEHRHLFEFKVMIEVRHDDRELEFLAVLDYLRPRFQDNCNWGTMSCEQIGEAVLEILFLQYGRDRIYTVSVKEDGENGAVLQWTP